MQTAIQEIDNGVNVTALLGAREALANDPGSRFYRLLQTGLEEVLA